MESKNLIEQISLLKKVLSCIKKIKKIVAMLEERLSVKYNIKVKS